MPWRAQGGEHGRRRSEGTSSQAETPRRGVLTDWCGASKRGLTFELRRALRQDAPPVRRMIAMCAARAAWLAVAPRLERGVRPRPGREPQRRDPRRLGVTRKPRSGGVSEVWPWMGRGKGVQAHGVAIHWLTPRRALGEARAAAHLWLLRHLEVVSAWRQGHGIAPWLARPGRACGCSMHAEGALSCWRCTGGGCDGLTFELRRGRRWDGRPARPMITTTAARACWPAVGPRLERGVRSHSRRWRVQGDSIFTSFVRPDAPLLMDMADLRQPKCLATSSISSAFALPSTGGDFSCARQDPSPSRRRRLAPAFGLTFTSMNCAAEAIGCFSACRSWPN